MRLWQEVVHRPGVYDLEVDTSRLNPELICKTLLMDRVRPTAFESLLIPIRSSKAFLTIAGQFFTPN